MSADDTLTQILYIHSSILCNSTEVLFILIPLNIQH